MGELDRDHPFIHAVQERVLGPRKVMMIEILERAVERGEIEPDAVTPLVAEAGPALIIHRLFCEGPPISPDYADAVLDEVVMRLLRPKPV
jgi:hypothetical protein